MLSNTVIYILSLCFLVITGCSSNKVAPKPPKYTGSYIIKIDSVTINNPKSMLSTTAYDVHGQFFVNDSLDSSISKATVFDHFDNIMRNKYTHLLCYTYYDNKFNGYSCGHEFPFHQAKDGELYTIVFEGMKESISKGKITPIPLKFPKYFINNVKYTDIHFELIPYWGKDTTTQNAIPKYGVPLNEFITYADSLFMPRKKELK